MLDLNKLTPSGLSAIFKGGVGSGIRGHRTYRAQQPKKSKHWQDVSEQLDKNLLEIADGKAKRVLTQGQFNEKNIKSIINNMRSEADLYTSYLASDTAVKLRDMTSIYENILYEGLRNGEFKDINTKDLDDFGIDNIKKMVHQEVESNRQQFTDHGIRHIFGNTQRQIEIMEQMGKASAIDKLSAMTIMVNHDMGYTTAAVRKGGVEGIKASSDHKTFSGEIINSQRPILNEGKLFSSKQFDRISEAIKTHDSAKFSKDNLLNSTRISDNLALFAKEKLPSMFKYVKGGAMDLVNMGEAAKNNDVKSFEVLRTSLYKKIDASNLNVNLKRDLKAGVREISLMTPKFSMGTLAGEIDSISGGEGKVNVTIKYSKWDAFLQTRFDMGQKQTKKLLNDYGITDFSKTNYSIGGVVNLKVVGASGKEIGLSAIFKHLPGKHDQRTHAPGGFVNQDGRKVPKYDPQGTYPLYHNTPGMYLPSILRLGIGETDKYSPLRGTETLKHDSRTSWTRDSGYTSVAGQWTPDRARLTINNKQDLIKDGLSTEPAVASLATDMQADKFIPAYFEHEEAVYGIIKPSMISRIDITQVDYDKMLRDRKNFVEWGEKAKNKPVRVGKEEFDREMNKISYESNKRAVADLDLVLNDKRLVVGEIKPIYKILGLSSFTKAKSKITYSPVDKDKHEFQFRESTSKNEKKLQKIIQDFFEDQKKEVLGLLKKDFEEIEQKHLLGQHDQLSHGGGGKGSVDLQKEGAVYVYRGEYIGLKDKILKNGIPKKSWNNRPASVYMTTDEKEAHMYGIDKSFDINKNAEAWEYLVVKIKIPKNEKIIPDERDTIHYGRPSAIRIEKSIPKDWIFDVSSYRGFDSYFGKTSAEIADIMMKKSIEENFAYITFVIVPELEVELSKSFYPLDTVEEQLLLPSLGLSRLLPPRKRVLRKGGPGSGNWEGPGDPRYAYESDGGEFTNKGGYNKTTGKINPPDRLFYKCSNPKVIIDSGVIKISEIYGGVSLTTNPKLKAHGNSLIEFKRTSWFDNGVPVLYLEGYERLGTNRLSPFKSYKDQFENIYTKEEVDNIPMKISSDYKGFPIKGNNMFRNEEEWRFSDNIKFSKDDIIGVRETKSLTKASPNSFPDRFGLSAIFKGGPGSGNFGHEGRPGEVGGSSSDNGEILYHGTSSKTINSILKNGLIPGGNHIRMPWADEFADSVYGAETEGRELSVFMTKSKSAAKTFAEIASRTVGGKPLILVIRLPNDKIDRLKQDERTPTALRYEGVILPEYISVLKKKDVSVIFYAVVLEKKIKEEKTFIPFSKASPNSFPDRFGLSSIFKGGPGSGNYGHEGRPGQIGGSGSGERGVFTEEEKIKDWQENGINAQAFKEWFGNSKVIDVNGNPLVVYHGTFRDFDKFGSYNSDYMSLDSMHRYFFTDNPGHAEQFIYDESRRSGIEEKPNIMPVYLSIQKPYESENPAGELVDLLKKQGYDGIHSGGIWIAFMPTQIKSAIGNQGTFDSKNPNINKSFLFKEIVTDRFDFSGWSFDKEVWNKRLQEEGGLFIKEMYDQQGTAAYDGLKYYVADLVGVFNMDDPRVQKFLKNYIFTFAKGINDTTEELLREAMQSGMAEGLGMDGIASKIEGLYDTWGKWRSLLIARTETIRASNGATAMAYEQSGVVSGKEWLVTQDDRTCFPANTSVKTIDGYKGIQDVQVGDLVLTHKDRYRKVVKTHLNLHMGDFIRIYYKSNRGNRRLVCTPNHPILINGEWKKAEDIIVGDKVLHEANPCGECGKLTNLGRRYCSPHCQAIGMNKILWEDPLQHERVSRQNKEFGKGKLMKSLHEERRQNDPGYKENWVNSVSNGNKKHYESPENREKRAEINRKTAQYPTHPFKVITYEQRTENLKKIMKTRGKNHLGESFLEKKVKWWLEQNNYNFEEQKYFNNGERRFWVDFYLPDYNIIIEADGEYFHSEQDDRKRDAALIKCFTGQILHFTQSNIMRNFGRCIFKLNRAISAQNCFVESAVMKVERVSLDSKVKQPVYNLTVEEDNSYVASRIVVHNCDFCLPMDGKVVDLNKNFFNKGDSYVIGEGDNKVTMKLDYEDVGYPPLHPNCRCALVPFISEEYQIPKSLGLSSIFKGGPGSGNWNGPGDPRYVVDISESEIKNSIDTISALTLSGGMVEKRLKSKEENYLKQSVEDKEYNVYRGLALMKFRLTSDQWKAVNDLKVGDIAPDFISMRPIKRMNINDPIGLRESIYSSSSKLKSVANYYSKQGNISLVLSAKLLKNKILADGEHLKEVLDRSNTKISLRKEDVDYYKKEKEVFLIEPVKYTVHSIRINKSFYPLDTIEEQILAPSLGLSRLLPPKKRVLRKGGPGSGNFGHEGRPGEVGGSGVGGFGDGILNLTPEQLADSKRANEILNRDVFFKEGPIGNKKFVQAQISNAIKDHPYFKMPEKDWPADKPIKAEFYVKNEIDQWAKTSGDSDIRSVGLQIVAKEIFNLGEATLDHLGASKLIDVDHSAFQDAKHNIDAERPLPFNQDGTYKLKDIQGRFLQAQYDATQKYFKDNNIKELILYRGVEHNDGGKLRTEDISLQPMSSFSIDVNKAFIFANIKYTSKYVNDSMKGTIYVSRIPVEKILSHPRTGFGCTSEKEVVVLGGKMKATIIPTKIAVNIKETAFANWTESSNDSFNDRFIEALNKAK